MTAIQELVSKWKLSVLWYRHHPEERADRAMLAQCLKELEIAIEHDAAVVNDPQSCSVCSSEEHKDGECLQ